MSGAGDDARCVLMFHRIVDACERDHDVSWESFTRLLDRLGEATRELTLDHGPAAVLTFDDGTADHAAVGERLAERGTPGVFFVSAGKLDPPAYLDEGGVAQLAGLGHEIGSHGIDHVRLERLSSTELRHELEASKERLGSLAGEEVRYFAPPGGSDHPQLVAELQRCGYLASRSTRWGIYRASVERWRIPCVPVTELTIRRGWVAAALERFALPPAMRAVGTAKNLLPAGPRSAIRSWSHR